MALFYLITSIVTFIVFLNCLIFIVWSYVTHTQNNGLLNGATALAVGLLVIGLVLGRKSIKQFKQQDRSRAN